MKSVFKIVNYILPKKFLLALVIGSNLLSVVFFLASFAMVIPFVELLFNKTKLITEMPAFALSASSLKGMLNYYLSMIIISNGKEEALFVICLLVVVSFLFRNLFRYMGLYFMAAIRNRVLFDIRNDIYKKILILPLSFFSDVKKGDLMSRISNDVQDVEWSIMCSLVLFFRDPISIVLFVGSLLMISPMLTLVVFILLPTTGFVVNRIGRRLKAESKIVQNRMGVIVSVMEEAMTGLRIIKAFNAIDSMDYKFRKINRSYTQRLTGVYRRRDIAAPLSEILSVTAIVLLLMVGGSIVLSGNSNLSAENFIAYIVIFSQLIPPVQSFTGAYSSILKGTASADRVREILDAEEVITEKPNAKAIHEFSKTIEFKNVSFSYKKEMVLKNINFTINKGETIAVVGPSGAGKTTIAELIPRFYDATDGEILIDGTSIKDYNIKDLRGLMGYVTQDPVLFNDTVINNICLGIEDEIDESTVVSAAKIANADEFINQLSDSYQTNIGDSGVKLSGGQKQRLCIARAIVRKPSLLIFDEATSSQDSESESLIQQSMQTIMKNTSTLVIAHKLSTVQFADKILVIDKGEIIEQGKHNELLQKNGLYKHLYDLQLFN